MSNQQQDNSGVIGGMIVAGAVMLFFAAFALFAFIAFLMTIACFIAWRRPLRIGKFSIEPYQAHAFVAGGVIGAIAVPAFVKFCEVFFGVPIVWDYLPMLIVGGYTAGSLFVVMQFDDEQPPASAPDGNGEPEQPSLPAPPREPFQYADWDDEEAGR